MSTFSAPYGGAQGAGDAPARPPVIRERVVASKEFYAANSHDDVVAAAGRIIQRHWGDISQFTLGQRQMGMVLPASYKRKDYSDLSMEYQRLGNQETIILTAYPETTNPNPAGLNVDLNFDGYVAWVHWQDKDSSSVNFVEEIVGPMDIFLNGYLLESNFTPNKWMGGYVVLFGPTALKAQSYQDDAKRTNNDMNNSNPQDKIKPVVPRPGWGKYPDGSSPTGAGQNDMVKELGYWIFDWTNPFNPCSYLQDGSNYRTWDDITSNQYGKAISLSKGIWFQDAQKSPLNPKGENNFGLMLSPLSKNGELLIAGAFIAEFYDRKKTRTVKSSWKHDPITSFDFLVNDSPLIWGTGYTLGGFWYGAGIAFDLRPDNNERNPGDPQAPLGPHDGLANAQFGSGTGGTGLDAADAATLAQWAQTVAQMSAAYNTTIQQYINAWTDKWNQSDNRKKLNQARNVEAWLADVSDRNGNYIPGLGGATDDPTGQDRVRALTPTHEWVYGPVQQYWWNWNAPFPGGNPLPKVGARWFASWDTPNNVLSVFDTLGNPGTPPTHLQDYGGSLAGDDTSPFSAVQMFAWAKNYVKTDALQQQTDEYNQIFTDHPPPEFPKRPRVGQDYTKFKYRPVTINGGIWSYPPDYSGGS